jgi:ubiquitin C-terminal hydrolase
MSIEIGISKFKNDNGISCYINSILHIIQQIPYFSDYIVLEGFLDDIRNKGVELSKLVVYELYRIIKLSYENDNINITPTTFKKLLAKKNPMWGEIAQQDSQEFLIFMITQLEEELGNKIDFIPGRKDFLNIENQKITSSDIYQICGLDRNKNEFSIIRELFIGSITSNIVCEYCNSHAPSFENFITLSLDIPLENNKEKYTLTECMNYTFKDEKFDKHNKANCDFCGIKNKSTRKTKLWKTPKILIIHLKRFKMNEYGQQVAKITNQIEYPINELNLNDYYDENSPFKNNCKYELIGVNIHEELLHKSLDVGHYVSAVKNRFDNKWYIFNDACEPKLIKQKQFKNAYMLFYIKK